MKNTVIWWGPCFKESEKYNMKIIDNGLVSRFKIEITDDFGKIIDEKVFSATGKSCGLDYDLNLHHFKIIEQAILATILDRLAYIKQTQHEKIDWTGIDSKSLNSDDPDVYFGCNDVFDNVPVAFYNRPELFVRSSLDKAFSIPAY